jgi:hypothetical protein
MKRGVYVGGEGVKVNQGLLRPRIVVPWAEITCALVADVPKLHAWYQSSPTYGLVLVAPSGQGRPLPVRLTNSTFLTERRGAPPSVPLTHEQMSKVIDRINWLAARYRRQPRPH